MHTIRYKAESITSILDCYTLILNLGILVKENCLKYIALRFYIIIIIII